MVELRNVSLRFKVHSSLFGPRRYATAVDDVSLSLRHGETFGLLGESGSGKSTLGRVMLNLLAPDSGQVLFKGAELVHASKRRQQEARRGMQMVFQDPHASFDPSVPIENSLAEPLNVHERLPGPQVRERLVDAVRSVGLGPDHLTRRPRQLSGGQLQRLAIARALTVHPDLLVLDEPVSALDMSTQAQIINLLVSLQRELGLSYLLISHNPSVVYHASHRIGVMYLGQLVEVGSAEQVHDDPQHPYTQALLEAVLSVHPEQARHRHDRIKGEIASNVALPSGCRFHPRCPHRFAPCDQIEPPLHVTADGRSVRCHLFDPAMTTTAAPRATPVSLRASQVPTAKGGDPLDASERLNTSELP